MANGPAIDILRPRSVAQILGAALSLYRRYPVLFIVLALVVTAPYELIVFATLGTAPIGGKSKDARWINVHEDDFDEKQFVAWVKQAAAIPGWNGS